MALGIVALFLFSIGFVYGVIDDRFRSVSDMDANFPDIDFPEITIPDCNCNCSCEAICDPNITVEPTIVYINITTNSSV